MKFSLKTVIFVVLATMFIVQSHARPGWLEDFGKEIVSNFYHFYKNNFIQVFNHLRKELVKEFSKLLKKLFQLQIKLLMLMLHSKELKLINLIIYLYLSKNKYEKCIKSISINK